MSSTILSGDFTVHYAAENNQKRFEWTGSATGTRSLNEFYSAVLKLMDDSGQMDDDTSIRAITPAQYRIENNWFIDDTSVEHLTGGSLFTNGWLTGSDSHILTIGYAQTTEFNTADIGRTIVGTTTADTGTILDFNTIRQLIWIRPTDPTLSTGDVFDDPDESYTIQEDDASQVWTLEEPATFVDLTSESTTGDADLLLMPATESDNDIVYFGYPQLFSQLTFNNNSGSGVAGIDGGSTVAVWQYWDGDSWEALTGITDNTSSGGVAFTAAKSDGQTVIYTVPSDWATVAVNGSALLYYLRVIYTTADYSTNPAYDTMTFGGVGAGAFARHGRHGEASASGESAWVGVSSIGARETETSAYVFMEDPDQPANSFQMKKVVATKGTLSWWPHDAHLDTLFKTKEADSVFGPDPDTVTNATGLFLMRQYSKLFSHFSTNALATAGGETVVPFSVGDDLNNTEGYAQVTDDGGTGTSTFVVDEVIGDNAVRADATKFAVVTNVAGDSADPILQFYYIDDLTTFDGTETITGYSSTATSQIQAPVAVGPATTPDSNVTITHGEVSGGLDINNGNGAQPYSIDIDPSGSNVPVQQIYGVLKYETRRGSATVFQGEDGEEYIGSELQVEYDTQLGGNFVEGNRVFDQSNDAVGIIVTDHDNGDDTGDLILKAVRGTFTNTNTISDSPSASQQFDTPSGNGRFFVDNAGVFTDDSADADSAGAGDVTLSMDDGDNTYIGVPEIFASVVVTLTTGGTIGGATGTWEYWNGAAWTSLEGVSGFSDGTSDFTSAGTLSFYPPLDWTARSVNDGAVPTSPVLYYIRHAVTVADYDVDAVLDQVLVEDFVTAVVNGVPRPIATIPASPFGTFAGGKFFGAPGVALVITNLASGEEQSYQLIDDQGATQVPPNTVSMTVDGLISGDTVAVFRRTGSDINKTQLTLLAGNDLGDATLQMNATISADNPSLTNSKIRVISPSNEEHRYRYASYATDTFTLATASTGTDDAAGSLTTIVDTAGPGATFQTDGVEVGDLVRNTTDGFSFSTVVSIDSETALTVTDNG